MEAEEANKADSSPSTTTTATTDSETLVSATEPNQQPTRHQNPLLAVEAGGENRIGESKSISSLDQKEIVRALEILERDSVAIAESFTSLFASLRLALSEATSTSVDHMHCFSDAAGRLQECALDAATKGNRYINSCLRLNEEMKGVDSLGTQLSDLPSATTTTTITTTAKSSLYEHLIYRSAIDVSKTLEQALTLVRKCKRSGVLRQVFAITTSADFCKVPSLLELSITDVSWLLFIASNDPILAILWFSIASIQMGRILRNGIDAANNLAFLGRDNDYNKKMIVKEGGVVPLLKLLKERVSPNAQWLPPLLFSTWLMIRTRSDPSPVSWLYL
ncbi:hypothetical protein TEA_017967 [Camellia sinensis var. sinensis]|uniref:Uncharacterized protein n=1 Tax=Camellia sinensis var. sinensis TaxID=542762 RepID=A0A4V3WQX3_CAMSN|nr:hypothetical protein TEA_017967 [Camellia sinensis var. sinensis]